MTVNYLAQNGRLLKWIVDDQQAFSVVEAPSISSFVNGINPNRLHALDSKVSLTYDVWTSKANLPYASVKVQYVDADWKRARPPAFFHVFSYPHTAQRHQDLIMDTIQSFGLETRGFSCVRDNEEATVQGLKAVKAVLERDYKELGLPAIEQLPLKKGFHECSKQLTSARHLGRPCEELSEVFSAYSEESIVTDNDEEDNLVDSFIRHVTLKLDRDSMEFNIHDAYNSIVNEETSGQVVRKLCLRSLQLCQKLGRESFWMETTGRT
ncbi:hypothetical protein V1504DRAFT_499167 [Lipomyces starkeyi]